MTTEVDPLYSIARRVLLDALDALEPHLSAVVLVGAQAVYLRTENLQLAVAPHTTDGDLVLDPDRLSVEPDLFAVMERAGFVLATDGAGHSQPGMWMAYRKVEGRLVEVPVDLIVPSGVGTSRRRSANLPGHARGAARTIPGLEAALIDHSPITITSLEASDPRAFSVEVAGVTALLIAKAYKIHERLTHSTRRPDRLEDKDAGDAYRLMQSSDEETCAAEAVRLTRHDVVGDACRRGLENLVRLFRASGTPGTLMAIDHFRGALPAERVVAVTTSFSKALRSALDRS